MTIQSLRVTNPEKKMHVETLTSKYSLLKTFDKYSGQMEEMLSSLWC